MAKYHHNIPNILKICFEVLRLKWTIFLDNNGCTSELEHAAITVLIRYYNWLFSNII